MIFILAGILAILISGALYFRTQPELSTSRRILLFSLRSITLFILLLILLSPIFYYIRQKTEAGQVLFLKDTSLSMNLKRDQTSKQDLLKKPLQALKEKYSEAGYKVLEHSFANGLGGAADNSLLIKSLSELSQTLDFSRVQAIVLSSDGWFRDEDYSLIPRLGVPIVALADSSRFLVPDLELKSVETNRYAYRNEAAIIRAKVQSANYSGPANVQLYLGKNRLATQKVELQEGLLQTVDFSHRFAQTGFFNFRVELEPLKQETRLSNNQMPGAIEVLADKELIVTFSDAPAWDNKFILDAVATNPRWQSSSYQIRDGNIWQGEQTAKLAPQDRAAVIVIVNNGNLRLNSAATEYITNNLSRGAGLLYQGLPIDQLAEYLPFGKSNIVNPYQGFVQISPDASLYAMLNPLSAEISKLPPLDYYYVNPVAGAEILASLNNPQKSPAIAIKHSGKNRTLALSFLNLWRWQMQSPDGGYQKMTVNILTWLSNKALGSYSAIYQNSYLQGEKVIIRLRAEDEIRGSDLDKNPLITILDPQGKEITRDFMVRAGDEYSFGTELAAAGNYSFEIREPDTDQKSTGTFAISETAAEERDFDFNLPLLSYLASESRGRLLNLSQVQDYQPLPPTVREQISRNEIAFYKKWYIISLFVLSFCLELFFRRRWGLL
ncbi:MAG: hypothetical protein LHW64_07990 [Candidatus Cloacimonetes bacterium]|jgi:hypothetical protein|nr:hypothetical protein [Candidatus Cloacimonadota bacterium]MCB5287731.1 hypothetical protein [Candidatus Cloacimonadota bacterium]MCK9185370.1 hypothetical protein [Candidatus Cloacimonadota bacterium]MCK9584332.1 hypothetical protein [Candidatus Cloacimonadota bacterium]MDY0230052.1 hypothetical protein [Candidatus Cloacimonadaceae bacterium]